MSLCFFCAPNGLLKLFEECECSLVNGVVLETYDTTIGTLLHNNTCGGGGTLKVATAEKVPYFVYIDAELICDALAAATGQFVLDAAQFVKGDYHSDISV